MAKSVLLRWQASKRLAAASKQDLRKEGHIRPTTFFQRPLFDYVGWFIAHMQENANRQIYDGGEHSE